MNSGLSNLQKAQLNILHEFVRVCNELKLRYFLVEGTMLGAKRHHGFIPWDDDIDVSMPRKDYEIFLKRANAHLKDDYRLSTYLQKNHYWMTGIMFKIDVPVVLNNASEKVSSYAWIDVIPLDGVPSGKFKQIMHFYHYYLYRIFFQISHFSKIVNRKKGRLWYEKIAISILEKTNLEKRLNSIKIAKRLHKVISKYDYDSCDCVTSYTSEYKFKEFMPRAWYGNGKKVQFEDIEVIGVSEDDKYLRQLYGDYMKLPPKEKQIGKHNAVIKIDD